MAAKFVVSGVQANQIDRQMCEIKRMLSQEGGSPLHPGGVALALQDIIDGKFFDWDSHLVHGVFNMPSAMVASFKARCADQGIDFSSFRWIGSEQPPDFDQNDPKSVIVLDATLDTLQNTFEFAWAWASACQEGSCRYEGVLSDPASLALVAGMKFMPWTIAWRTIKLDTFVGEIPMDVRRAREVPGCALLFMAAEHPAWIRAIDEQNHFGFWLPGLKNNLPGQKEFSYIPYVFYDASRKIQIDCFRKEHRHENLAVPCFLFPGG